MMILKKAVRTALAPVLLMVFALVAQGFGQSCCLGTMYTDSAFKADMQQGVGATNITILTSTCTEKSASGSLANGATFVQTLKVIQTVNLEQTVVATLGGSVVYSHVDTLPNACEIAVEKKPIALSHISGLSVSPNPFQGKVNLSFSNELGNASLQIFDAKGVLVHEIANITSSRISWNPSNLKQGVYFARIRTAGHVYVSRIICLK
jgi:hypothetical protein